MRLPTRPMSAPMVKADVVGKIEQRLVCTEPAQAAPEE